MPGKINKIEDICYVRLMLNTVSSTARQMFANVISVNNPNYYNIYGHNIVLNKPRSSVTSRFADCSWFAATTV